MATFYLLSLLTWLHADRVSRTGAWRAISAALFAAALLVKETAVTLPFALLLLDALAVRPRLTARQMPRRQLWHWLVLCGGLLAFAASPVYRHLFEVSLATRGSFDNLLTQVHALVYLAAQLLLPWRMNIDPDLPVLTSVTPLLVLEGMAICALIVVALRNLRRRPWLAFAILWFFLHLLPTNSVLPRLDVANDRQLYLASIGAFYALGIGVQQWMRHARRAWPACAICALLLLVLGAATVQRNQVYASAVAFWEDAFEKSPGKPRVANNLGYAYQQAGRYAQAERAYRKAIELDPDYGQAHINLDVLQSTRPR
jgi:tetratricopeptide (TPR) repeat protein